MLSHGDPHKGKFGGKKRPHEIKFRKAGFDRDLMRLFGYNLEKTEKPNNWIQVNHESLNISVEKFHLQKVKKTTQKRKKKYKK